ncbi:hypothetical protein, conserved [Leishmania lindenbergi]|uniref:Uncharacterized protein n=1 Tax=Leishmania lindenbergi TaxID=651832 RepID=A0AAW3AL17_9TRYP
MSRSVSPSSPSPRVTRVSLETIEKLQDAWSKRYETLRGPPPPPLLNSPRSLRACALANVNPQSTLQKLSLKQHLFCVLGNPHMLSTLPDSGTAEYRVLMQSALRCFSEAAVGLGTSKEKLAAFIAFKNQEELRVPQLASLRELRRQLMAKDVLAKRKRHEEQPDDASSMPICNASSAYRNADGHAAPHHPTSRSSLLRSPTLEENLLWCHGCSARHWADGSPTGAQSAREPSPCHSFLASVSFVAEEGSGEEDDEGATGVGRFDLAPTPSPSGKLPYKPRDVSLLNSSYFANRNIQSNGSNPSNALLPISTPGTPSPSWRGVTSVARSSKQPVRSPQPLLEVDSSLDTIIDVDSECVLVRGTTKGSAGLRSVTKQELSIVSINTSQFEELLNIDEPATSSPQTTIAQLSTAAVLAEIQDHMHNNPRSQHTVMLFHESGEKTNRGPAAAMTAGEAVNVTIPQLPAELPPAPPSQSLTPRGFRGYTTHTNFASLMVPNMHARPVAPPAEVKAVSTSLCVVEAAMSRSEKHMDMACEKQNVVTSTTVTPTKSAASAKSADAPAQSRLRLPPMITKVEENEGFLYYCANPSHSEMSFYAGGRDLFAFTVNV